MAKRRTALSQASPYVVANLACADSYGFFGGKLCYIIEERPQRWLRILDLRRSTDWELVVDIPTLVRTAVPRAATSRKYKFRVLYQAAGIVSCLFSFARPRTENWLLIFKPDEHELLEKFRLESTARIFVRNNESFLYFGTLSWEGADGLRKWVIQGFDIGARSWIALPRLYMANLAGCDMGSTVCFEIFGGYFYGLSNQRLFEADDPEWMSHYYCFRFPLHEPRIEKLEVMGKEESWRRRHAEGPIDDRWGFLSLEMDEHTEKLVILECRKEWLKDRSGSQRTYYTTEVVFRQQSTQGELPRVRAPTVRRITDHPQGDTTMPSRRPEYVHAGDDSSVASLLTRNKTYFCGYIRCSHTFIDLIDDPCNDGSSPQQLRLRTGYRKLQPGTRLTPGGLVSGHPPAPLSEGPKSPASSPYQPNKIFMWPPERGASGSEPYLDRVQRLLNIDGHQGSITATGDERSVIYTTGNDPKGLKILVLISFDPATRFRGLQHGGNLVGQEVGNGTDPDIMSRIGPNVSMGAMDETGSTPSSVGHDPPSLPPAPKDVDAWVYYEKAMHFALKRKLHFSR